MTRWGGGRKVCHGLVTPRRATLLYAGLCLALGLTVAGALLIGTGTLSDPHLRATFLRLRAIRLGAAFCAGAALAVGGVLVQGLFRNPLASPSILGTTAGASLGGQLTLLAVGLLVGPALPIPRALLLPFGCVAGAALALAVLLAFVRERSSLLAVLLTGFILSSLFLSLSGFVTSVAQESWDVGRAVVAFSLGSVDGTTLQQLAFAAPMVLFGVVAAWFWGRPLDVLLSGEDEAASLGVDVASVRRWCAVWVAMLTAAAVSVGGGVGFVGLIIPHAMRPMAGVSHRRLVPASAVAGGLFLALCDVLTRAIPSRSAIPLGVVTGLIGAPVFLFILLRGRTALAGEPERAGG